MNSVTKFSIPCLLSRKEIQSLRQQVLEECPVDIETVESDDSCVSASSKLFSPPLPETCSPIVLSLNSDEVIKDSRFREQISNSTIYSPSGILASRKDVHFITATLVKQDDSIPLPANLIPTHISNPKDSIVAPLKIKRTRKLDGTFDYRIHKEEELRSQKYHLPAAGNPVIINLSCNDRPTVAGLNDSGTAVSLEWMDDGLSHNSSLSFNNTEIMVIEAPFDHFRQDELTCDNLSNGLLRKRRCSYVESSLSDRGLSFNRRYHNGLPLKRNGYLSSTTAEKKSDCISRVTNGDLLQTPDTRFTPNKKQPQNGEQLQNGAGDRVTKNSPKHSTSDCHSYPKRNNEDKKQFEDKKQLTPSLPSTESHRNKIQLSLKECNNSNGADLFNRFKNDRQVAVCSNKRTIPPDNRVSAGLTTKKKCYNNKLCSPVTRPVNGTTKKNMSDVEYQALLLEWQNKLNRSKRAGDATVYVQNIVDKTIPPLSFNYISQSIYTEGVPKPDPTALVGCSCVSCKDVSHCCPHMAGHKFAYYKNGKLRVGFRTPIYECNSVCQCGKECLNRVVQKGSQFPLCIFRTADGRGWGVKTCCPIEKGKFVTEYVGELITCEEAERRGEEYDKEGATYLFDLDFNDVAEFTIDAALSGNVSHFLNHSCDPNLIVFSVWIDTLDLRLPRLALFARRDIEKGEELTFDYQMNHNMTSAIEKRTPCLCGTKKCRRFLF